MRNRAALLIPLLMEKERSLAELAGLLDEERRCIVGLDPAGLEESVLRKENVWTRLARLGEECTRLLRNVEAESGESDTPTLSPFIAGAALPEQAELRPLQRRLIELGEKVRWQTELNRMLLVSSLDRVRRSLALFTRLIDGAETYGFRGHLTCEKVRGRILCREL